jgi:predicted PurR-regulated permease PerM
MTPPFSDKRDLRSDIVFAFVLAIACYLAWVLRDALVLLYVSALFAVIFNPVVRFISRLRVGRWQLSKGFAVFILLLTVSAALALFVFLAVPPVIRDLRAFAQEVPTRLPQILEQAKHIPFAERLDISQINSRIQDFAGSAATFLLLYLENRAGNLFDILAGLVLVVYFILEGDHAYSWFLSFFPPESRERLDRTLQRAEMRIGKWLFGQGSLMLILGVSSTIVFLCLHMRYAYALGVLAGLLNLVPVMGVAITIVLALLVAAIDSWGNALGVTIFFLLYVQIENSLLTPRIMKNSVDLPGLAILVALLLGSALEGILGAMVSVPTAVLVAVLVDEYLVHKDAPQESLGMRAV